MLAGLPVFALSSLGVVRGAEIERMRSSSAGPVEFADQLSTKSAKRASCQQKVLGEQPVNKTC